ncbi:MAG TPA: signal peptidase I [Candidatus Acidoferrales bacterium]|nr:signal peptidase I [Candidatus Acidoferrales bacterium]
MAETVGPHEPPETPAAQNHGDDALRDYLASLLITIIIAVFGATFVVQAFEIPSPSMSPTLLVGDHLLVNKFIFGGRGAWYDHLLPYRPIRRGDVIVFKYSYDDHPYYVKRVIALPGDRVHIADQRVYVNDTLLIEPYAVHDLSRADPYMFDFPPQDLRLIAAEIRPEWTKTLRHDVHHGELLVPANDYFVVGDNRDNSSDSRYWGFVPRDAIAGRPLLIYWSIEENGETNYAAKDESKSANFLHVLGNAARMLLYLPTETRWSRMFREVH